MKRSLVLAGIAVGTLLAAGAAQAGNVYWSIGINVPPVANYVSNGPAYYPGYAPRRFYREPQPVYYVAPPRAYAPPHVWLPPLPRLPPPPWAHRGGHHAGHWDRGQRWDHGQLWDHGQRWDHDRRDHYDRHDNDRHDDRGWRGDGRRDGHRR